MTKFVQDILSARRKVDELFREAALVLNAACSSDEKVKQEMHEAVDRYDAMEVPF
jgi:hypothetical protein